MDSTNDGIAVIGMAGRFPGANNVNEFWKNLLERKDSITRFTDDQLASHINNYDLLKDNPNYIKARGILENIDLFDAGFFGITPLEAKTMDPQHRVWLETAWEALENAACNPHTYKGAIGVFAGTLQNTYLHNYILKNEEARKKYNSTYSMESFQLLINNDPGFLPTKTAYKFNLRGPAINVQTACSTSLVAIAQACQSLYNFESDICVSGGISISLPQKEGYLYEKGSITSPNGQCRPFDIKSNGTVASNGIGVVILKRLEDAINDKDHIYSVIKGWATNNDGSNKVSFMAPSVDGQAEAIMMAQAFAEINPKDIGYVEAHGTATPLGDPIEIAGLTKAFRDKTNKKQFCGIGSVKSNIGHLDAAAGVAGFIKSSLATYYKTIPASIHFNEVNPNIDIANSPFYVQKEQIKWKNKNPLNIGLSSFGLGGTNAHVILQQPPQKNNSEYQTVRPHLILLSAKSENSLNGRKNDLIKFAKENRTLNLSEMAFTLQTGRSHMPYKCYSVIENIDSLTSETAQDNFIDSHSKEGSKSIVFMFPGQGAQYINMGKNLYENEPFCKDIFETCFSIFEKETGEKLQNILFANEPNEEAGKLLAKTEYTQPALFIIEYAVAIFLKKFGINPDIYIGHSIGEYTAACLSGVFSMEDALRIVIKRGQLMQRMPEGSMLAVKTNADNLKNTNNTQFEIAAINAPDLCVISISDENLKPVKDLLNEKKLEYIPLNTSHAFHSASFDPILEEFAAYVSLFNLNEPTVPFISCVTGEYITVERATDPDYWASQLRNPIQFSKGISTITESGEIIFIEAGPNTHLTSLVRRNNNSTRKSPIIATLAKPNNTNEQIKLVNTIGRLWAIGLTIDFDQLFSPEKPNKIVLPTYPFDRKKYWIEKTVINNANLDQKNSTGNINQKEKNKLTGPPPKKIKSYQTSLSIIKEILIELTGFEPENINNQITFSELGMESLLLTQYAQNVEKRFKIKVEFRQLIHDYPSLSTLSEYLDKKLNVTKYVGKNNIKTNNTSFKNFIPFKPEGSKIPLVFVHGDNSNNFLPNELEKDQPYLGFLHLGADGEKFGFNSVETLAGFYINQLLEFKPEGPFILGGHSFGGIVAYEMANQLIRQGFEVPKVILSDSMLIKRVPTFAFKHGIKGRVKDALRWRLCKSILAFNIKIPVKLRNFYILNNYDKLADNYTPPFYNGHVLLLKASINEYDFKFMNWKKWATDISVVELEGEHNEIINNKKTIIEFVNAINQNI